MLPQKHLTVSLITTSSHCLLCVCVLSECVCVLNNSKLRIISRVLWKFHGGEKKLRRNERTNKQTIAHKISLTDYYTRYNSSSSRSSSSSRWARKVGTCGGNCRNYCATLAHRHLTNNCRYNIVATIQWQYIITQSHIGHLHSFSRSICLVIWKLL